ncbi:MAG: GNAT family N-acetyltransferase [Christensenella sp.]
MKTINYRPIQKNDYPQIIELLSAVWQFDKYINDTRTAKRAGESFWLSYIARQNYAEVAERDGEILGLLLGHCAAVPFSPEHENQLVTAKNSLRQFMFSKEGRKFYKLQKRTAKYERQLLSTHDGDFDSELVLFATAPAARGLGIGKALLCRFNAFLQEHGALRAHLMTDSFCNVGFYDHLGYSKVGEKKVSLGAAQPSTPFYFYLYAYKVDEQ